MTEFFSDISLWLLVPLAIIAVTISFVLYRKKGWIKEISAFNRFALISLRSLGLFLIGLLLLGILIKGVKSEVDQPLILTLVDNSESMLNYSDSSTVEQLSKEFITEAGNNFKSDFNSLTFDLNKSLENPDSLVFNNSKTDLSQLFNRTYNNYYGRNIGAVILLSDGNYNEGSTPLSIAQKFKNTPVYTLSVGDTIQKVDHSIKNITSNKIAFLDNKFPVEVSIEGNKTPEVAFEIKLIEGGKIIDSKTLKHQKESYSLLKTEFILDAKSLGIHEYTVQISAIDNEYNLKNNEKSFFVEVLDDRSNVLLVSEGINPDVGAIKNALSTEDNLQVKTVTIDEIPTELESFDLVIWHNPGVANNNAAFNQLLKTNTPKWFIVTAQTKRVDIAKIQLLANISTTGSADNFGATFNPSFNLFKLSSETQKNMNQFPPLNGHYGEIRYANKASILAYQSVGGIQKQDALFFFGGQQDEKFAVTYGSGLWSWRIADYQMNQSHIHFNEIVHKTVQYLILKENTSRLRIQLPSVLNSSEEMMINAAFYNKSYEAITTPTIQFELTAPNGEKFDYSFLPLTDNYALDLGQLNPGKYTWKATTEYNGSTFMKEGTFGVKSLELEKQSTKSDHQMLIQMAENGNGKFAMLSDYQSILDDIKARDDITPVAYEASTYHKLIDYIWLMFIIISLFTIEWVMRRYLGSY